MGRALCWGGGKGLCSGGHAKLLALIEHWCVGDYTVLSLGLKTLQWEGGGGEVVKANQSKLMDEQNRQQHTKRQLS